MAARVGALLETEEPRAGRGRIAPGVLAVDRLRLRRSGPLLRRRVGFDRVVLGYILHDLDHRGSPRRIPALYAGLARVPHQHGAGQDSGRRHAGLDSGPHLSGLRAAGQGLDRHPGRAGVDRRRVPGFLHAHRPRLCHRLVDGFRLVVSHGYRARLDQGRHVGEPADLLHLPAERPPEAQFRIAGYWRQPAGYRVLRCGAAAGFGRGGQPEEPRKQRMTRFLLLVLLIPLAGCRKEPPLPVYWQVPAFQLTAQSGQPFDSKSLEGNIWVADFIFTTCPGPCPRMSAQMRGVQAAVETMPDVKLVSFTVDPKNDTPVALAAYATRYRAEPGRWFFLTGDQVALENICRNGFKLGDVDGSLVHSTRFVLLDRHSRVRGFYSTSEDGALPKLLHDIRTLAAERS